MKNILIISFVLLIYLNPLALTPSVEPDKYKKWLNEEVFWLITPEEKDAFEKLTSDKEKENFVSLFWAKRDPTPLTKKNEFKENYYATLDYVNKMYTKGQETGWKTDVGKTLLFFGTPRDKKTNPETWIYDPIPPLGLADEFQIVFDVVENRGLVINPNMTSKVSLEAMDEYASRTIFHPDLTEAPDYSKISQIPDELAKEMQILKKASLGAFDHEEIPCKSSFYFRKAKNKKTSLTLVYFFESPDIVPKKVVLFGVLNTEKDPAKSFRRQVELKKDDYYAHVVVPLLPARYELVYGLKDVESSRYSIYRREIEVPDYWMNQLELGALIITDRVETVMPDSRDESVFNFGQFFVYPKKDRVFNKTNTLNILYQIYNAKIEDGQVKLRQEIQIKSEARSYTLPAQPLEREVTEGEVIVSGFPIPLTHIDAGEYMLIIRITDKITNQVVEKTEKVTIVEPSHLNKSI